MSARSNNNIQIIGGKRDGEYIKWFGNRVHIDGVPHVLIRDCLPDGAQRLFYIEESAVCK